MGLRLGLGFRGRVKARVRVRVACNYIDRGVHRLGLGLRWNVITSIEVYIRVSADWLAFVLC